MLLKMCLDGGRMEGWRGRRRDGGRVEGGMEGGVVLNEQLLSS